MLNSKELGDRGGDSGHRLLVDGGGWGRLYVDLIVLVLY